MKYNIWVGARDEAHAFRMLEKAENGYVLTNYTKKWSVILRWKQKPSEDVLKSLCN